MRAPNPAQLPPGAWNQLIQATTRSGSFAEALRLYASMRSAGVPGDLLGLALPSAAKACATLRSLRDGAKLHAHAILMGFQADVFVQTSLIDMYSKCSHLASARHLFDEMPTRTLVSWNSMISAYATRFNLEESFRLFHVMRVAGVEPSSSTCVSLLSGCTGSDFGVRHGLSVRGYTIRAGLDSDLRLVNSIVNMYVKFGLVTDARFLFESGMVKSNVTWTAIMGGYVRNGDYNEVFSLFNRMQRECVDVDSIAILNLASACALLRRLPIACSAHAFSIKRGFDCERIVLASLVHLYANCSDLASARKVFDSVEEKDISLWSSMIGGHVQGGQCDEALLLFQELSSSAIKPNEVTVSTVLSACANFGSLSMGEKVEEYAKANGLDSDLRVQTALIRMYCKCGSIKRAKEIFDGVSDKDIAIWSTMINGYACHGKGEDGLALFKKMRSETKIRPDAIVFTDVLSACSHSGFIEDGLECFNSMLRDYGIKPNAEHYLCIVDLLSRAGYFNSALSIIQQMPVETRSQVLPPLLSAYRAHHGVPLDNSLPLVDLEPRTTGNYVLMANIHASLGNWKEAIGIRKLMDKKGLIKEAGWSRIELHS